MNKALIIVDVQKGFINDMSEWLPTKLADYIKNSDYDYVIATQYINHEDSSCYKYLNWTGCMDEESQSICEELDGLYQKVVKKDIYSSATLELMSFLMVKGFDEIHICGISESCCVLATAYELFDNGFNIKVIPALCAVTNNKSKYKSAVDFLLRENVPCLDI